MGILIADAILELFQNNLGIIRIIWGIIKNNAGIIITPTHVRNTKETK